jgi:nicotinate-nucleotide adenylyltransferase
LTASRPLRVGMYGGAFDPPHLAHQALAQAAIEQHQLEALHVVPLGRAWYKKRTLSSAPHRLAMAQLAFAELPQVKVDPRETERSGPSYTLDTLRELQAEYPLAQLFLVLGQDQLEFFPQWHGTEEIIKIATLLVAKRPIQTATSGVVRPAEQVKIVYQPIVMPHMPHSSTHLRELCAAGADTTALVNPAVARYIAEHQLYSTQHTT